MQVKNNELIIIGYGGHALVVTEALRASGREVVGYCDSKENPANPMELPWLGPETSDAAAAQLQRYPFLVTIGSNQLRAKISRRLQQSGATPAAAAIHPSAQISPSASIGAGSQVQGNVVVNALATIGQGVILNTGCVVEHEVSVGDYAHIAPGAVLTGNVSVGEGGLVGANATVIPGVRIGKGATIGAGAVVLNDVPDGGTVAGNPARLLPVGRN